MPRDAGRGPTGGVEPRIGRSCGRGPARGRRRRRPPWVWKSAGRTRTISYGGASGRLPGRAAQRVRLLAGGATARRSSVAARPAASTPRSAATSSTVSPRRTPPDVDGVAEVLEAQARLVDPLVEHDPGLATGVAAAPSRRTRSSRSSRRRSVGPWRRRGTRRASPSPSPRAWRRDRRGRRGPGRRRGSRSPLRVAPRSAARPRASPSCRGRPRPRSPGGAARRAPRRRRTRSSPAARAGTRSLRCRWASRRRPPRPPRRCR